MLMFDTLNRRHLPPYGCDWVHAPNFQRLAERSLTFDNSYVCSMPCMPARRDLHTGRPNFLHRGWGPLEPYDDSLPEILKARGIYTHLCSDHLHYWEEGGATYHTRYNTWEAFRGNSGDPWMGQVAEPEWPNEPSFNSNARPHRRCELVNRQFIHNETDFPATRTFRAGMDFIERNHEADQWFLQIETFDPHEPFFSDPAYQAHYREAYEAYGGRFFDWPEYRRVEEPPEEVAHLRTQYAALLSMCDARLGEVLDLMDRRGMWDDTLLIVWTDHGFLLGEHDCYGKMWLPWYEEIAHTPFFVWDPRSGRAGERRSALVQPSIDLAPTILGAFGLEPTADMLGHDLANSFLRDAKVRDCALFGSFGHHVNITDGRYVYMRGPKDESNGPCHQYGLMPCGMTHTWKPRSFAADRCELAPPFSFTKGAQTLKIPASGWYAHERDGQGRIPTLLFDLENDPGQHAPIQSPEIEARLINQLIRLMRECDAPKEQFERLGLNA